MQAIVQTQIFGRTQDDEYWPKNHPKQPLTNQEFKANLKFLACRNMDEHTKDVLDVTVMEIMIYDWTERTQTAQQKIAFYVCLKWITC